MTDVPEILAVHGKSSVVRLPGRRYAGVWLPADTLYTWLDALEALEPGGADEGIRDLADEIRRVLQAFSTEMKSRGESLPFEWPRPQA